jgi:hypothetical protein
LKLLLLLVLFAEAFDAPGGVDQLLLAGEERMAVRTDLGDDFVLLGGPGFKGVAAMALDRDRLIFRMDSFFHDSRSWVAWRCTGPMCVAAYRQRYKLLAFTLGNCKLLNH